MTTAPEGGGSLKVIVASDVSDGFRHLGDYNDEMVIERAGALNIERKGNGREEFEVSLIDKQFHYVGRPARINLATDGVFELVQACRDAWDAALRALTTMQPSPSGGEKAFHPYENNWENPVDELTFRILAGKLAVAGERLFSSIFERGKENDLQSLAASLRDMATNRSLALTVYAPEFHIPWRLLYTHPRSGEKLAKDGTNFDPNGFWGYRHVVEQFTDRYVIKDHVVARGKLGFGAALHERIDVDFHVDCIKRHRDFVQASATQLDYQEWTKKAEVVDALGAEPFLQQVIYFLCHGETAGTADKPELAPPCLQLANDERIRAIDIRQSIANGFSPSPPLVFINACRGGQLNTLVRHSFTFASQFLEQGAVCVVGPQIEIPAVFAGEFGKRFFERLLFKTKPPPQVGLVLRDLTREMWNARNPFGLVYSLYAGADCHIRWEEHAIS
jgi:hypothetical protein